MIDRGTLDRYGHLCEDEEAQVTKRLNALLEGSEEAGDGAAGQLGA